MNNEDSKRVICMRFENWIDALREFENAPVSLQVLMHPFGVQADSTEDEFLVVGLVIEELLEEFQKTDMIDLLDVATAVWTLGHDRAERFLDQAPELMIQILRQDFNNDEVKLRSPSS